ncbi:uncharacterized protein N7511_007295 [Penicillium nucicola]|uniref:uncharacterized protein n=1 Tax=Penicillium nucicola TaxID=1850975 RepID=UPI002545434F|nr:uncharacterized protein N7511_007295 [Penicillium nucicola]KAJ5757113.1 hypothetical protein N7511_007295 [Penicillium nucicola]
MALRRPHRKSRHGCVECKRRRVKCDETRPSCTNCAKRHADCEYESATSLLWANEEAARSRASGSESGQQDLGTSPTSMPGTDSLGLLSHLASASSLPSPALNISDLELMMQWCNATYHTLSRNERTDPVWRTNVPEEALSHPFLMHGVLAVSALHLARTGPDPSNRASYLNRAVAHQNQALALFRELLGDVNENNAKAMFAFAGIVVIYTFGFPHTPDAQDAWACVDDLYQVLVLTRGVQQVIYAPRNYRDFLRESNFGPILQVDEVRGVIPDEAKTALQRLYDANEAYASADRQVYRLTIENLEEMLSWVYGGMRASTIAGRWAIRLPGRFMECLRERDPLALVMLAHYGVLLTFLEHRWCFDEWCVRIARAVWAILDPQWRPLVLWAMKEILGVDYLERL